MGRSIKCTYKLKLKYVCFRSKSIQWMELGLMRKDIKPNVESIKKYRDAMNKSMMDGSNQHLNKLMSLYSDAILINQNTGERIEYKAPMFEII